MKYNLTKTLALAALALAVSSTVSYSAKADTVNFSDNLYLSGSLGLTIVKDESENDPTIPASLKYDHDNALNINAALGKHFTQNIRGEVELGYRSMDTDIDGTVLALPVTGSADTDIWTLMVNGYYDFDTGTKFRPYVGAGIGVARYDIDMTIAGVSDDEDDTVFAYQIGTGVTYNVAEQWDVQAGYRFLSAPKPEYDSHEFRVGFIRSF